MSTVHKYHYIYKTTCLVTNKYYIGMHSTSNLKDGYIGSGRRLWLSINKYGKDNHIVEILEFLPTREALKFRERELVNEDTIIDPMCMNLQLGGEGGFSSPAHQFKCSQAGGLTNNPEKSRKASERLTATNKLRVEEGTHKNWKHNYDWQGKTHTEEAKKKIGQKNSIKQTGESNSQFGTKWVVNSLDGTAVKAKASDISSYLVNGYSLGRKLLNK